MDTEIDIDGTFDGGWRIVVLIPARNEETLLPRCLRSVLAARASLPANVVCDIVVVSDASTDRTAEAARAILGDAGLVLETHDACVGKARANAARAAAERCRHSSRPCWLANTDADCEVPPSWLLSHLRIARAGYRAVAGIIDVTDFSEHLPSVRERFLETYLLGADGSHAHIHGANLGIHLDAYLEAGGWNPLATAEDSDLWTRLLRCAGPLLTDSSLCVTTSGRRVGRAPLGFAAALAAHNAPVSA